MKKFLLLIGVSIIMSSNIHASHLLGGGITWECLGGGQYEFTLKLYRDCQGILINSQPQKISGPNGPITLNFYKKMDITPTCHDTTLGYSCLPNVPLGQVQLGSAEVSIFKGVVMLPGSPPSSGWKFSWTLCCRPGSLQNTSSSNYYIESIMYPSDSNNCSSPKILSDDLYLPGSINIGLTASKPQPGDSLYYDFYAPMEDSISTVNFFQGYSTSAPLPNSQTNSANGPVSIDHQTGLVHYDIKNASVGSYAIGVEIECWSKGALRSIIRRDASLFYTSPDTNSLPIGSIDTSSSMISYSNGKYKSEVKVGDTLVFEINASDTDVNLDSTMGAVPQMISFDAVGTSLDTSWGGTAGFQNTPTLSPVAPQAGFTDSVSNNIRFEWVIAKEHLSANRNYHYFVFQFRDDACPFNGKVNIPLEVLVKAGAAIDEDTLIICKDDSLQLKGFTFSGNYKWYPNISISDTAISNPLVFPAQSRFYYLEDPNNQGFKDSVYVQIESNGPFQLDSLNATLQLIDSVQFGTRTWHYNGIPFYYPHDTLSPFGPGNYWVTLQTNNCYYTTDTVTFSPGGSFSIADPNQGNLAPNILSLSDSWGVQFELTNSAAGNLNTIYLPGIDTSGETSADDLQFQLYDSNGNLMWSKDTVVSGFSQGVFHVSLMQNLQANEQYTLAVTGDSGYVFHYFEDIPNLPVSPWNNGLSITGLFEGAANTLPAQPHNKLLPLVLEMESTIGLEAYSESKVRIYPNPAQDRIYVDGAKQGTMLQIIDVQGRVLREVEIKLENEVISFDEVSPGIYILRLDGLRNSDQKIILK